MNGQRSEVLPIWDRNANTRKRKLEIPSHPMAKRRKLSITTKKQTSSLSHPAESELELDVPPRSGPVIARRGRDTFEANRVFQPSNDGIPPLGFSSYGVSAKQCFSGDKSVVSGLPEERTRDSSDSEGGSEDAVRELLGESGGSSLLDYDPTGDLDDQPVTLGLTQERSRDFSDSEDGSGDTVCGPRAMSGDSPFTDCDSVEGFGDESVTLRLAEERSSDFSDSDESRDTIHGLSPMLNDSSFADYDSTNGFDDESVTLGLTEERYRDFSSDSSESGDTAPGLSAVSYDSSFVDYDSAEGFDDESVMLGLTEERCRDFSDPESESEDPARERSAMSDDSSFADCDPTEGSDDESVTLGFTEEHSSDFSDSDESGETVRELSAMSNDSSFADYDSAEGFDGESVMLGLTEEQSSDFSDLEDGSEDAVHELSVMSSGPPSVGCGSTGDPGAQFVTLELGGGCLGHVSNSEDGADDEAENIPGLARESFSVLGSKAGKLVIRNFEDGAPVTFKIPADGGASLELSTVSNDKDSFGESGSAGDMMDFEAQFDDESITLGLPEECSRDFSDLEDEPDNEVEMDDSSIPESDISGHADGRHSAPGATEYASATGPHTNLARVDSWIGFDIPLAQGYKSSPSHSHFRTSLEVPSAEQTGPTSSTHCLSDVSEVAQFDRMDIRTADMEGHADRSHTARISSKFTGHPDHPHPDRSIGRRPKRTTRPDQHGDTTKGMSNLRDHYGPPSSAVSQVPRFDDDSPTSPHHGRVPSKANIRRDSDNGDPAHSKAEYPLPGNLQWSTHREVSLHFHATAKTSGTRLRTPRLPFIENPEGPAAQEVGPTTGAGEGPPSKPHERHDASLDQRPFAFLDLESIDGSDASDVVTLRPEIPLRSLTRVSAARRRIKVPRRKKGRRDTSGTKAREGAPIASDSGVSDDDATADVTGDDVKSKDALNQVRGALETLLVIMRKLVTNNHTQFQEMTDALHRFSTVRSEYTRQDTRRESQTKPKSCTSTTAPTNLKRDVRQHSLALLGRKDRKSKVPAPPDPEAIRRFNQTGKGGPKAEPGLMRLDLDGPVRSPWNRRAAHCFRKHFRKSGLYERWPKQAIEDAFLRHTLTIRSHYLQQKGVVTDHDLAVRRVKGAQKNRLRALANNRRAVCVTHKDMERFKKYIDILAEGGGMSGDESDRGLGSSSSSAKKYFALRPVWRSKEVSRWLRVMDLVHLDRRFAADGRTTRGNWTRCRIPSNKVDQTATPIPMLPSNFYDTDWLSSLTTKEKKRLKMQPGIDLTHTEDMLKLAARYSTVRKRTDRPLEIA